MATNPPYALKKAIAKDTAKSCPYAGVPFEVGNTLAVCAACGTPHLQESWNENRGCTTYGCENAPDFRKDEPVLEINLSQPSQGDGDYQLNIPPATPTRQTPPAPRPLQAPRAAQQTTPRPQTTQSVQTNNEPDAPNNPMEYAALAAGIGSMLTCFCFGLPSVLLGISAVICWYLAINPKNRDQTFGSTGKLAFAGLICGLMGMLLGAVAVGYIIAVLVKH